MLQGKRILLGICGGIAAYKAAALCSKLVQAGAKVNVIMTESATKFIAPLTLQTLSREPVAIDTFDEKDPTVVNHIHLADHADLVIVAPATANMIAKLAYGLADDMLSTTLLATTAPILIAPAMNVHMYAHPAVQQNMRILADRGVRYVEPGTGQLACGYVGKGRLAEPEDIVAATYEHFGKTKLLQGLRIVVTAGGTKERIDPVRYISNDSSGKMGYAIAEAARDYGAEVTLVSAADTIQSPAGIETVPVQSAQNMMDEVISRYDTADVVIKAAAVSDYRMKEVHSQKIKKTREELTLTLVKNPDILQTLGSKKQHQFLVGFAAETTDVERYAMDKLQRKNCDLIVANDVTMDGAGFGTDTNIVNVYDKQGLTLSLPMLSKREVAEQLLKLIADRLKRGNQ